MFNNNKELGEQILEVFKAQGKIYGPYSNGEYLTRCIHHEKHKHDDRNLSMSFNPQKGAYCKACGEGWGLKRLSEELGINPGSDNHSSLTDEKGISLEEFASAKGLDIHFLKSLGWQEVKMKKRKRLLIPYCNERRELLAWRYRVETEGDLKFLWEKGAHAYPYGLPRLRKAREAGYIILVEGETDAATLWQEGFPALGIPGATVWREEWTGYLQGIGKVYVWQEPDKAGDAFVEKIADSLEHNCYVVGSEEAKDVNELHCLYGDNFPRKLAELLSRAEKYQPPKLEVPPKELTDDPHILRRFIEEIANLGLVGEERMTGILTLVLESSGTDRPINAGIVSPSSSGKSHLLGMILSHFPDESYIHRRGGSERSFVFSDEPMKNRFIVFDELRGYSRGEVGEALLRSLIWDRELDYEVTLRRKDGKYETAKIKKLGPTGLLFTSTSLRGLDEETRNRLFLLSTQPGEGEKKQVESQTEGVLYAIADRLNGSKPSPCFNTESWKALFRASLGGVKGVEIPWGRWLANRVDASNLGIRRKFELFLYFVYSSALLHRFHRLESRDGRIVADVRDYANACALIGREFENAQGEEISPRAREIAEVVRDLHDHGGKESVTVRKIAEEVGLSHQAVHKHLNFLDEEGYVQKLKAGKGKAIAVIPGEPLPDEPPSLPIPEDLARDFPELGGEWINPVNGELKNFVNRDVKMGFKVEGSNGLNSGDFKPEQVEGSLRFKLGSNSADRENLKLSTLNHLKPEQVEGSEPKVEGEVEGNGENLQPSTSKNQTYEKNFSDIPTIMEELSNAYRELRFEKRKKEGRLGPLMSACKKACDLYEQLKKLGVEPIFPSLGSVLDPNEANAAATVPGSFGSVAEMTRNPNLVSAVVEDYSPKAQNEVLGILCCGAKKDEWVMVKAQVVVWVDSEG